MGARLGHGGERIVVRVVVGGVLGLLALGPMSGAHAAAVIGETERVVSEVRGFLGEITRELKVEDEVFTEEVIETGDEGATRIVFVDGTELSMGPLSRVILDRYVYDPATGTGELVANFVSGIFEFASGLIPSTGYDLRTPFANLAIRGTVVRLLVGPQEMEVSAPEGRVTLFRDGEEAELDDPLNCVVWTADGPELRPLEDCTSLMEQIGITMALLLDIEPAAPPPPVFEFPFDPAPQGFEPLETVSPQ
jgi:hypothetical protein